MCMHGKLAEIRSHSVRVLCTKCTFLMLGKLSKSCKMKYLFAQSDGSTHGSNSNCYLLHFCSINSTSLNVFQYKILIFLKHVSVTEMITLC